MPAKSASAEIPLPRGWPSRVKSAILHVISLAQFTAAYTRGWAANSGQGGTLQSLNNNADYSSLTASIFGMSATAHVAYFSVRERWASSLPSA